MSNQLQESSRLKPARVRRSLLAMLLAAPVNMALLPPLNEELLARGVGVVPAVGVTPGVPGGLPIGVAVGVGDGGRVGVGTGAVVTAVGMGPGSTGVGVEPTAVGDAQGPLEDTVVAVRAGGGIAGVGVAFLPNGPGARVTERSTDLPVETSQATT